MKELTDVLATMHGSKAERVAAQKAFLRKRGEIWKDIREGRFPATYTSANNRKGAKVFHYVDNAKGKAAMERR